MTDNEDEENEFYGARYWKIIDIDYHGIKGSALLSKLLVILLINGLLEDSDMIGIHQLLAIREK